MGEAGDHHRGHPMALPAFLVAVRLVRIEGAPAGCFALHVVPRFIIQNTLQVSSNVDERDTIISRSWPLP